MNPEDKNLFHAIYEKYHRTLRPIVRGYKIPEDEIDDVIHEVFVSYMRYNYRLDLPVYRMKALLTRMTKNQCVDYIRWIKLHECVDVDGEDFDELKYLSCNINGEVMNGLVEAESCKEIINAVNGLKEKERDVVIYALIQRRPIPEVCKILGISESACYSRIRRAREHLEKKLKHLL